MENQKLIIMENQNIRESLKKLSDQELNDILLNISFNPPNLDMMNRDEKIKEINLLINLIQERYIKGWNPLIKKIRKDI